MKWQHVTPQGHEVKFVTRELVAVNRNGHGYRNVCGTCTKPVMKVPE